MRPKSSRGDGVLVPWWWLLSSPTTGVLPPQPRHPLRPARGHHRPTATATSSPTAAAAAATAPNAMADPAEHRLAEEEAGEDEETGAQVAHIVKLEEVAVTTGEEDEDVLLDMKAKLYRFDKEGNQWKERGTGTVKLLKHMESDKVRLVMRQAKTLKICANHLVVATTKMQEHAGSDKSCVWHALDFADGELKEEMFAIRFGSVESMPT